MYSFFKQYIYNFWCWQKRIFHYHSSNLSISLPGGLRRSSCSLTTLQRTGILNSLEGIEHSSFCNLQSSCNCLVRVSFFFQQLNICAERFTQVRFLSHCEQNVRLQADIQIWIFWQLIDASSWKGVKLISMATSIVGKTWWSWFLWHRYLREWISISVYSVLSKLWFYCFSMKRS